MSAPSQRVLAWALRPFSKVHPAEVAIVAVMTLAAFCLLTAYYLLKTVREPLILLEGGAEVKLYARASQALIMLGVVHVYGELARRFGRTKLLTTVFLFFISNLVLFAMLARRDAHDGGAGFDLGSTNSSMASKGTRGLSRSTTVPGSEGRVSPLHRLLRERPANGTTTVPASRLAACSCKLLTGWYPDRARTYNLRLRRCLRSLTPIHSM